jgi:AcrR family transcriptional regulator
MQKRDKREAILQAALELVAQHGFQHTPMSLIVKHSGASAGIIYHYFDSKDDLIQALYRRVKSELGRAILATDVEHLPLAERFPVIWLNAFHYYATHPAETAFLQQYESVPDWEIHMQASLEEVVALFHLIEEYKQQRLIKDLPMTALYELTLGVALRLARQYSTGQLSIDDDTLTLIARSCWDAIARGPSHN